MRGFLSILLMCSCMLVESLQDEYGAEPCCVPETYQMEEEAWWYQKGAAEPVYRTLTVHHVDFKNHRYAQNVTFYYDTPRHMYTMNFNNDTSYHIDLDQKLCDKVEGSLYVYRCMSSNMVFLRSSTLGGSLLVDKFQDPSGAYYEMEVTREKCMHVTVNLHYDYAKLYSQSNFYNVTLGIDDDSVFDIPSYCPKFVTKPANRRVVSSYPGFIHVQP